MKAGDFHLSFFSVRCCFVCRCVTATVTATVTEAGHHPFVINQGWEAAWTVDRCSMTVSSSSLSHSLPPAIPSFSSLFLPHISKTFSNFICFFFFGVSILSSLLSSPIFLFHTHSPFIKMAPSLLISILSLFFHFMTISVEL